MTKTTNTLIAFSTSWGTRFGGINSFNQDLLVAFAGVTFQQAQTVCVVLEASQEDIESAAAAQVQLISIENRHEKTFSGSLEAAAWVALTATGITFDINNTVWLGHDRITGEVALAAAEKRGGRTALIHHMSYGSYEAYAENSSLARTKGDEQKSLFERADLTLAVGPLLRDALIDMLDRQSVRMLVPGLPDIKIKNTPRMFKAFLSGRLSDDAKKIKQAHLGVAAFADAIRQSDANSAYPDALRGASEPRLTLRGIDFEKRDSNDNGDAELELKRFAEGYARRAFALHALPFTTDREVLFADLAATSLAMMPSWHEGFGLVAWEAIAAGVPLILSKKSGVFRLLNEADNGLYTALIIPLDVAGSSEEPYFLPQDLSNLAQAIIQVAKDPAGFKQRATRLREALAKQYTWAECARGLVSELGWQTADDSQVIPAAQLPTVQPSPEYDARAQLLELPSSSWEPNIGLSDSRLLRAEEAIIPFDPKREPFLREQLEWATSADFPIAIRLLTGVGGVGKTRLALELCDRLRRGGWQVGFLRGDYDVRQAGDLGRQLAKTDQDCCLVVDYAETRQPVLLGLLRALLATQPLRAIRILLLARDGGEWWNLLPSKDVVCEALLEGMASTGPFQLPKLHDSESDRQLAYQLALHTFAKKLDLCAPTHAPRLDEPHFAHPLYVQMAALIALRGERPKSAEALTRTLVSHERRYWQKALTGLSIDVEVVEREAALLMSIATLANGIRTSRDIEKIWVAAGGEQVLLKPLFAALAPLYPGRQGLDGWRPDLLGEGLIAQVLLTAAGPDLLAAVLGQSNQRLRQSSFTLLARLLRNRTDLAQIVENALVQFFVHCVDDLIAACIETPSILPQIAERAFVRLDVQAQGQAAGLLIPHLKFDILPLTGLDVVVSQFLVDKAKRALKKQTLEAKAEYGRALANLSVALTRDGHGEAALHAAEQAAEIGKSLVKAKPDRYEPALAASLHTYATRLGDQGDVVSALSVSKQVLNMYQKLAKIRPERYEPEVANSLGNYARLLLERGMGEDAFAISRQSLEIRQGLAKNNTSHSESALAMSLSNHATILAALGRTDEGINVAQQALEINARLAKTSPARFEASFATSLNNYASFLFDQGKIDDGIIPAREAMAICQRLAQAKPERFLPDLALSLSNYASFLSEQGRIDDGLVAAKQALEIRQRLSQGNSELFESDLATSLSNYSNFLEVLDRSDDAIDAGRAAMEIQRRLAEVTPERFEIDLASSLIRYAEALSAQGRNAEAINAVSESVGICQQLARATPERFEPDLASALVHLANIHGDLGDWESAAEYEQNACVIYERCALRMPTRYLYNQERSRIMQLFWAWIATGKIISIKLEAVVSELITQRDRFGLSFQQNCLLAYIDLTKNSIECALLSWECLNRVQQHSARLSYLTLRAISEHKIGPNAGDEHWHKELAGCRERMQGQLPRWMLEVADRAGFQI
jgi:glycosyltransferase involved in cell wall biosynthesis